MSLKQARIVGLILFLLSLLIASEVHSKNRFPIITYADDQRVYNRSQFYKWCDEWGVTLYHTTSDSISKYVVLDTLDYTVSVPHLASNQRILLDSANTLNLYSGTLPFIKTIVKMGSQNTNVANGYAPSNLQVGEPFSDVGGRIVQQAVSGVDSPGYLFQSFSEESAFRRFSVMTPNGYTDTLTASLRLFDDSGSDTTIVAILECQSLVAWECATDSMDPRSAIRVNDSLLIVGSTAGWTVVTPLDTLTDVPIVSYCSNDIITDGASRLLYKSCYVNPDDPYDTLCVIPWKTYREIRISDFADTSSYQRLDLPITVCTRWNPHSFRIYWTGERTLAVDSLWIYDNSGYKFDSLVENHLSFVSGRIDNYYDNHPDEDVAVSHIYLIDEPIGQDLQLFQRLKEIVREARPEKSIVTTHLPYHSTSNELRNVYDVYEQYAEESVMIFDIYRNLCNVTMSSDIPYWSALAPEVNAQFYVNRDLIPTLENLRRVTSDAGSSTEFWCVLPTFSWFNCNGWNSGSGTYDSCFQVFRLPYPNEIRMWARMALLNGAKGLGYWGMVGRGGPAHRINYADQPATVDEPWREDEFDLFDDESQTYRSLPGSPTPYDPCETLYDVAEAPYVWKGMISIDSNTAEAVRDPLFYVTQDINLYCDSMAYFFRNAEWKSIGRENQNLSAHAGSDIDSIISFATYDTAFVQVGFFEHESQRYAYILNRRIDDGTYDHLDSQTVRVYATKSGRWELWDVYNNTCDTLWDSLGTLSFDLHLDPAEAILLRLEPIYQSWSDTLDQSLTVPDYATFNLKGDVIVNTGDTLLISEKAVVNVGFWVDSSNGGSGGGSETGLTELIVKGTLRLLGSSSDTIEIGTDSAYGWSGITSITGASVRMKYAHIKNAEIAIKLNGNSSDSLEHLWIEDPSYYGLYVVGNDTKCYIEGVDITHSTGGSYGAYFNGSDSIEIKSFSASGLTYGLSMTSSYADMHGVAIVSDEAKLSTAMLFGTNADADMNDVVIYNYETSISHTGLGSDLYLINSAIYGDSVKAEFDSLKLGIYSSATQGSLKIRDCCFGHISHTVIKSGGTQTIDLGIDSTDKGGNIFEYFTSQGNAWPDTFLYQIGFLLQDRPAQYNYFEGSGFIEVADYDTSNATGSPSGECPWTPPPGPGSRIVSEETVDSSALPLVFELHQNYPNPFNPSTEIAYTLVQRSRVSLKVYNILGQLVHTLVNEVQDAGEHSVRWNSLDKDGDPVASGVYLYKIETETTSAHRKMLLIK